MSKNSIEEYTEKMHERYAQMSGKQARNMLLDEFVEVSGWERKYANKVLLRQKRKRAIWNRGQHAAFQGLERIWESQPFILRGVDSENGGEFLNFHLYDWLRAHGLNKPIPAQRRQYPSLNFSFGTFYWLQPRKSTG